MRAPRMISITPTNSAPVAMQCGQLREALARDIFPGEAVALQVCRGPMSFGPGDVPVRDVVVTLR
jgi:hypothetical protein